jgi:hypothetical protein
VVKKTLSIIVIIILSCSCRTIKPERPDEYYSDGALKPPVSNINVPVDFDVRKLEKLFNKEFTGLIYSDTSFTDNGNDNLKLKAYKRDNITFTLDGGQLYYRVPLYVVITKKFDLGAFGLSVSDTKEASASIVLKFKTKLSLNADWTISSYTASDGYEWITTPVLKLGPIDLPLPVVSDMLVGSNLGTISKEIDAAIKSSLDLRKLAGETWQSLRQPLQVSNDPPLWVLLTPVEVSAVPVRSSGQLLLQTLGIRVIAEVFYGPRPVPSADSVIPVLKFTSRLDEGFTVSLMTDVPFTEINVIARQQLSGYTMTQGKYSLRVEDAEIFGNGEKLVLAAKVSGSVKGTIFLTGEPYYDKLTSSLRVRNIDFDLRTKNALVKSASWVLRGGIVGKVSEKLAFPVGDLLLQARSRLQFWLSQKHSYSYFTVSGTLEGLDLEKVLITKGSVRALFTFKGKLNLGLTGE